MPRNVVVVMVLMTGFLPGTYSMLAVITRNRQHDVIGSTVLRFSGSLAMFTAMRLASS